MAAAPLVDKARKGDKEALIELVMLQKSEYYKLAYVYMDNQNDAMDALQEMIVIIYDNIRRLKNPDAFYGWSRTILANCCRKLLRSRKRLITLNPDDSIPVQDSSYRIIDMRQDIMSGLKKLNMKQQEAIKLKYFLDLDTASIADLTGVPEGTVKSRIFNGLQKLRVYLEVNIDEY